MSHDLLEFPDHPLVTARRFIVATVVGLLVCIFCASSVVISVAAEEVDELRGDIPETSDLRSQLDVLLDAHTELVNKVKRLRDDLKVADASLDQLTIADRQVALEIKELQEFTRRVAVTLFLGSLPSSESGIDELFGFGVPVEVELNQHLLAGVDQLRRLGTRTDDSLVEAVALVQALQEELELAYSELVTADLQQAAVLELLIVAEAWDRAEDAIASSRYGFAPKEKWEALRFCESSDNYAIVSPSGKYRGAYQFDYSTWETVGGSGDPAAASPSEQDARARELYALRGAAPWPTCGRYLK